MVSEAQKRATARYQKAKVKAVTIKFYPAEMQLWEHLQTQENKQGYIKDLIRQDVTHKNNA